MGNIGYSGDNGPATAAAFNFVTGIGADAHSNLFVCDRGNSVVRRIDGVTNIVTTIAGSFWADQGDAGPAIDADFQNPSGCAVDEAGDLFIADNSASRIRVIDAGTAYIWPVAGVSGVEGATGDGGPALSATLSGPTAFAIQRNGNLYVADNAAGRVRALTALVPPCTYTLSQTKINIPPAGGPNSVGLTAAAGCSWTAASNSSWLTLTSPVSGTGSATIAYTATASAALRYGSLTVGGQRFNVIQASAVLSITKTHTGTFTQGQTGVSYTIAVSNAASAAAASGQITVLEEPPTGLTVVSMSGTGWNCPAGAGYCNRSDGLNPGASYPAITVIANVASNAPAQLTNVAAVSGGGSPGASASDSTTIMPPPAPYTISKVAGQAPQTGVQGSAMAIFPSRRGRRRWLRQSLRRVLSGGALQNLFHGSGHRHCRNRCERLLGRWRPGDGGPDRDLCGRHRHR